MNIIVALSILFGVPTIVLAFIYYSVGINNYWQLFVFFFMVMTLYMPGMLLLHLVHMYHVKNELKREFRMIKE